MIQLGSVLQVNADLLTSDIGDEIVVLDVDSGRYFNLDPVGSMIWRGLEQPRQVAALCQGLGERFDAEASVIERDVLDFLELMLAKKLIFVQG